MKVAVSGATGIVGTSAVRALVAAGHNVIALARTPEKADGLRRLGAEPARATLSHHEDLVAVFEGADAVCNFAAHIPAGYAAALPGAWRENDRLRTEGVRSVVAAARDAGVRRVVQESVSLVYADNGDDWITEESPLGITRITESASVGESHVQDYECGSRQGVVLRLGAIVGDNLLTRWLLRSARNQRQIGVGRSEDWAHLVHTDDVGPAVVAALSGPSGLYNVGAEPVRRADLARGLADAVGQEQGSFFGDLGKRLAGARVEPMTRSLRVSSGHFTAQTGWTPRRVEFDASWFDVVGTPSRVFQ